MFGSETVSLTAAQNGPHSHQYQNYQGKYAAGSGIENFTISGFFAAYGAPGVQPGMGPTLSTLDSGSGAPHANVGPSIAFNVYIRI